MNNKKAVKKSRFSVFQLLRVISTLGKIIEFKAFDKYLKIDLRILPNQSWSTLKIQNEMIHEQLPLPVPCSCNSLYRYKAWTISSSFFLKFLFFLGARFLFCQRIFFETLPKYTFSNNPDLLFDLDYGFYLTLFLDP